MGNIIKFAWRNTWRNRRRTYLTLMALAVGVMCIVFAKSFVGGIINSISDSLIKGQTGHIRIVQKEYLRLERIMPKEHMVTGLEKAKNMLSNAPELGINIVDERIKFNVLLSHGKDNEPALAIGINPEETDKSIELSKTIIAGHYFGASDKGLHLIIGKKLAQTLNVSIDDELLLVTTDINYSTYALPFKVAGIFETGFPNIDKHTLYIPLQRAQEMLDCGDSVHEILLYLQDPAKSISVSEEVKSTFAVAAASGSEQNLSVIPWQKNDLIENALPMVRNIYDKILGIIMLIVALVILNTMLMAVMERYHEIGVLKAMGFKNSEIFAMIFTEAFYIGVIGSILGGITGSIFSFILEKTGIDFTRMGGMDIMEKVDMPIPFFSRVFYPDFSFSILTGAIIFGIVIALLAVLYPAFKSAKMQPVEAFRSQLKV
jgi:putative ABC transport system permease protein